MQRVGHLDVRSAVLTVLSALLLLCTVPLSGVPQAPHLGPAAHRVVGLHLRTGPVSAAQPGVVVTVARPHRASQPQRLDGAGPAVLPGRIRPPRPSYVAAGRATVADRLDATAQVTANDRAPPA